MNNRLLPLVLFAALLFAGSVLAQPLPRSTPSGAASDREDRHCTSTALSADPTAPCSDDAINDRRRASPVVVRPPAKNMGRNRNTGTSTQPGPKGIGKASASALGSAGSGSTGSTMGTHQQAR